MRSTASTCSAIPVVLLFASPVLADHRKSPGDNFRPIDQIISLQSVNYPERFVRHSRYRAVLNEPDGTRLFDADSSFRIVPGLSGEGISFESINYPGHYLRHRNYQIELGQCDNKPLFALDASFRAVPGLCGDGASFESVNYPGLFIRHKSGRLVIDRCEPSGLYRLDASFVVVPGAGPHSLQVTARESFGRALGPSAAEPVRSLRTGGQRHF